MLLRFLEFITIKREAQIQVVVTSKVDGAKEFTFEL